MLRRAAVDADLIRHAPGSGGRSAAARVLAAGLLVAVCGLGLGNAGRAAAAPLAPELIFVHAKDVWRTRQEVPFVSFGLRERYTWRGRVHDNWWQAAYRDRDRDLALRRTIVPADEEQRLKGSPISLHIKLHHGRAHADTFDTNPDADAFPILDPLIEPNAAFGLVRREPQAALVGARPLLVARPDASAPSSPAASPSPAPPETARPAGSGPATEKPLRELVRVEAVARDYTIALAGTERVRGADTYHLTLTPLHEPHVYRLRDLWVDTGTYVTVQLAVQGLFEGRPYDDARWIVTYVPVNGRNYVQQIHTDDALRFGLDRIVTGLQFDFVEYAFPADLPDMTFRHMF